MHYMMRAFFTNTIVELVSCKLITCAVDAVVEAIMRPLSTAGHPRYRKQAQAYWVVLGSL